MNNDEIRRLLETHGPTRPQPPSDWTGPFALPPELIAFYSEIGPDNISIDTSPISFFLPRLSELWEYQAGYRWNANTDEPLDGWNDDWLVVADYGADPFIYSKSSGAILYAEHGTRWDPGELFPNVFLMAASLATIGGVAREAGQDLFDDDCFIQPRFVEIATNRLTGILGDRSEAVAVLSTFGWS